MIRLLKLELLKARPAKFFWVLLILYGLILISIPFGVLGLGDWLVTFLPPEYNFENINLFFDWQDIWQNMTFLMQFSTYFFLNALVIIHVAREFSLKTARQNVIDGMSKAQFVWSKVYFIVFMALILTFLVFGLCALFAALESPSMPFDMMIENIHFIPAYFVHLLQSMSFAMLVAVLIRKPGIAVVVSFGYIWFDLLMSAFFRFEFNLPILGSMFPVYSQYSLIDSPFLKFFLSKVNTSIEPQALIISIGWIIANIALSHLIVSKRNL
ncbi:MAG: hypothetical protein ACPGWM_05450 [Flavobacteriales bacterium]